MKTTTKILTALALFATTVWGVMAYQHLTSPETILKWRIAEAREVQSDLREANKGLRAIEPVKQQAFDKAQKELQDVQVNIFWNSARYDTLENFIRLDQQQLDAILEADKNIGSGK